jgi:predicted amidophosphoribosyltransferase
MRLAERGYNQAALLAARVARGLGARFAPRFLSRTVDTRAQAGLDRSVRRSNVASAFSVRPGLTDPVRTRRVLLVDDVMTTGATLEACRQALVTAGSTCAGAAVLARTPATDHLP